MRILITLLLAVAIVQIAFAQDEPASGEKEAIAKLIAQLDSEQFQQREEAARELQKIGVPAIEALTSAVEAGSIETKFRSLGILKELFASENAATKQAATKALKRLAESDDESTRRSAENILTAPQYEIPPGIWRGEGTARVFGGERPLVLGGDGGVSITGEGIRIGSGGQLILAQAADGARRIDLIKGTGVGILLLEDDKGIEIHLRQPQDKGDPKYTRYLAKDAAELEEKHPTIHKAYKALDVYQRNQTIIGGVQVEF